MIAPKNLVLLLNVACVRSVVSVVLTSSGPVEGLLSTYHKTLVDVFLGIPFAMPPIGELRFRRTVPVQPWSAPLKANSYPAACIQYFPFRYPWVDFMIGQSEDCLYLNIWSPRTGYGSGKKAVMFWLYGGGYNSGSNRIPTYDGGILSARGDVVVVSVNHRLGIFGFLSTPSEEARGNMGLYDVLEALRWVKRNIRAFGGDPDNITIFGQSAGALTIGLFCTSPLAAGLFRRAILESAAPTRLVEETSYLRNLQIGARLATEVGCAPNEAFFPQNPVDIIQCLRTKDARTLAYAAESLNNFPVTTFNYVYGDELLPTNPRLAVRALQFTNVDVMIGNTQDEGSFRLPSSMPELFGPFGEKNTCINKTFGIDLIRRLFGSFPAREAIVEWYLGNAQECDYDYVRRQVYNSNGDYALFCPDVYFAERYARKGNPVYFYYFNHKPSITPWAPWMGVAHGDEVPFVFGRPLEHGSNYTFPEKKLSEEMIKMWTNFAKFGSPSQNWPSFSRERPYVLTFQLPGDRRSEVIQHFNNCDFFRPYFGFE